MRGHGMQILTVKVAAIGEQQITAQAFRRRQLSALGEGVGRQHHLLDTFTTQVPGHMQFHRRQ